MKKVAGISILLVIIVYASYRIFLSYNPDIAYEWVTNNNVPKGVNVISYSTMLTDNFFHLSHFWEFTHNQEGMSKLLQKMGDENVFENYKSVTDYRQFDAIWVLPDIEKALNKKISRESIGKGYEINIHNNNRTSWLLVDKNGNRSYYEYN